MVLTPPQVGTILHTQTQTHTYKLMVIALSLWLKPFGTTPLKIFGLSLVKSKVAKNTASGADFCSQRFGPKGCSLVKPKVAQDAQLWVYLRDLEGLDPKGFGLALLKPKVAQDAQLWV